MKIVSLPKRIAFDEWKREDVTKWHDLLKIVYYRPEDALKPEIQAEIQRLRKEYQLDRFYQFN
jgi:hypothetical protein